jgi:catechol 2,3-dioxygenase-like lactoylglutathione lyase family enzyme
VPSPRRATLRLDQLDQLDERRSPVQLQPHHIGIVVSDLERSTAFYGALGFETVLDLPFPDGSRAIRFIRLGGFEIELFWYAEPASAAHPPAGKGQLGFRHFALSTPDIEATLLGLKSAGLVTPECEVHSVPAGYRLLFLRDPDGTEIEIMQEG